MLLRVDETLAALFPGVEDDVVVLAISPDIRPHIDVAPRRAPLIDYPWRSNESRAGLIATFQEESGKGRGVSALWIASSEFQHFHPEELGQARIGGISFFSSRFSPPLLKESLRILSETDYQRQLEIEKRFLEIVDDAERLVFRDEVNGTEAILEHQACEYWFSLHGPLARGQQTVLPTGELSVLANASGEYEADVVLPLNGEIVLHGEPVTHRGDERITLAETENAYARMSALRASPVVGVVENGIITDLRSAESGPNAGLQALEERFQRDARFRKIHEIGFGTNESCRPLHGDNFFADERFPGVHFGLGLGGYLDFHFDIVCPDTSLWAQQDGRETEIFSALGVREKVTV
jgi:hypothetical protein